MRIQILGSGCAKCKKLAENAEAAARTLASSTGVQYTVEKVTDPAEIVRLGVMLTPALVVDGRVKVSGRVVDPQAIKALLSECVG